jgi:uncharacterized protein (TIGR03032 family)
VISHWQDAASVDPKLLESQVSADWWDIIAERAVTLLVGREYEHLLISLSSQFEPTARFMPMPHPSGIAVDRQHSKVYVASTRNPNQVFELAAASHFLDRNDIEREVHDDAPIIPLRSHFLPGCMYIHDLALIGGKLYANAVGENAIAAFDPDFRWHRAWWPKCVEKDGKPDFTLNYIQLNSIAGGQSLEKSFFTASSDEIDNVRPGDPAYPVDKRGVLFSGATREPVVRGLTRPHSARLDDQGRVWLANSGYGEFGVVNGSVFESVCQLPGWTRGVAIAEDIAFVGTSRVIPKFKSYAPGLDIESSVSGVHAVELSTGKVLGSIVWPNGNQIFAIDWLPCYVTRGLPFSVGSGARDCKTLFYTFATSHRGEGAYDD